MSATRTIKDTQNQRMNTQGSNKMKQPAITVIRNSHRFLRFTASVVLVAFTCLVLEPAVFALRTAEAATVDPVVESDEAKMSKAIQKAEHHLALMEDKLAKGQDIAAERQALIAMRTEITAFDQTVMAGFQAVQDHIVQKGLPDVIMQRHNDTVAKYQAEIAALLQNLDEIEQAPTADDRKVKVKKAKDRLKASKHKRWHHKLDPNNMPNRSLQPNPNNKPKTDPAQFTTAGLFNNPNIKLAALGDFTFDKLPGASDPAFLAATTEVTLSPAIQAKAAELNHDPVKIYHWVRNNVQWQPAWGAMQNADLTLGAERGNAFDISSLLIALLRASGIPSRYVHGTIDVPKDKFLNWVGGFTDVNAAMTFAASGGIPVGPVTSGGQITKMRMEHIWVEAAIDYQPSKGAKNIDADSWVSMDPSYKQYTFDSGSDGISLAGIDTLTLAQNYLNSGEIGSSAEWMSGFDSTILENAQAQVQTNLDQYVTTNYPTPTIGNIVGGRKTIIIEYPILQSSIPNRMVVIGTRYGILPDSLKHKISFSFARDILGDAIDPISFSLTELNNEKVNLSFKPATPEDEQTLLSLLPQGLNTDISEWPTNIPSYLINVIPELAVKGQIVKEGAPMQLGEELSFSYTITYSGHGKYPYTYPVIAGSYLSVAVVGANVSQGILQEVNDRISANKVKLQSGDASLLDSLTRGDIYGDIFFSGLLNYYSLLDSLAYVLGEQQNAHHYLASGNGTFGYEPNVDYFFGIPRAITPGGAVMNIPMLRISGIDNKDPNSRKTFNLQVGMLSSLLEHVIPEQLFKATNVEGVSAVKALAKAKSQGQRIYQITPSNQATVLAYIHHDESTMSEIRSALAIGKHVVTHTNPISVPGWTGAGYLIIDPITGDGAYKIGGGLNGGGIFTVTVAFALAILLPLIATSMAAFLGLALLSAINILSFSTAIQNALGNDNLSEDQKEAFIFFSAIISIIGSLTAGKLSEASKLSLETMGLVAVVDLFNNLGSGVLLLVERLFNSLD